MFKYRLKVNCLDISTIISYVLLQWATHVMEEGNVYQSVATCCIPKLTLEEETTQRHQSSFRHSRTIQAIRLQSNNGFQQIKSKRSLVSSCGSGHGPGEPHKF